VFTDDVEWDIPGMFHAVGKEAFDREIENEAFVGSPTLTITRLTEENDVDNGKLSPECLSVIACPLHVE
jgi:hypothetical protein